MQTQIKYIFQINLHTWLFPHGDMESMKRVIKARIFLIQLFLISNPYLMERGYLIHFLFTFAVPCYIQKRTT